MKHAQLLVVVALGATLAAPGASGSGAAEAPAILCNLAPGTTTLPIGTRHGLIDHLSQYPNPSLATPRQRRAAQDLLAEARRAVTAWPTLAKAQAAGYVTRTALSRNRGAIHYFHAERGERHGKRLLDARYPKALIYANVPGRPLTIVGVMFSVKRGERGPTAGGPITRWHSHLVCASGRRHGEEPPSGGSCPRGTRLRQGSEMMHLWFTNDLRSAFAIRAPDPELCRDGLLPRAPCRQLGGLGGM